MAFFQYGLKTKVPPAECEDHDLMADGRVGRKKKKPAEMAAGQNADDDDDDFTSKFSTLCCCLNFV